ncbi:hypothetical protein DL95DRAFT_452680 [Leptodontidium sp. 2 PMI_412]|nr:hypothetical protein DL95DRAFT_452680 [Leptodontidium sp. 2 PMI_412]
MAMLFNVVAEAMSSLAKLPRKLLYGLRMNGNCTDEASLERGGLPIDMGAEGMRQRPSAGQQATFAGDDGGSPTTTSGTLTPGSGEPSTPIEGRDDAKAHLVDSFIQTTLRRLSTNFSSAASSQEALEAKILFDKSRGYDQFKKHEYEKAPMGFPRLSKYIATNDGYQVYRGFNSGHIRLLLKYEVEITELEKRLEKLDEGDIANPDMTYRLRNTRHEPHWDTERRELENDLEAKLMKYDEILLKHAQVQGLARPSPRNHRSVFNWIWTNKPLDKGFDDFIFFANDMVTTKKCGSNYFEEFIEENIHTWPVSKLKRYLTTDTERDMTSDLNVTYYSQKQLESFAGYLLIGTTVVTLLLPVFLLFLVPMSRILMCFTASVFVIALACLLFVVTKGNVYRVFIGTATYGAVLVVFLGNISAEAGGVN